MSGVVGLRADVCRIHFSKFACRVCVQLWALVLFLLAMSGPSGWNPAQICPCSPWVAPLGHQGAKQRGVLPMGSSFSKVHFIYIWVLYALLGFFLQPPKFDFELPAPLHLAELLLHTCYSDGRNLECSLQAKSPKTSEVGSRAAGEDRNPGAAGAVATECHSTCGGGTSHTACSNVTGPRDPRQTVQETFLS